MNKLSRLTALLLALIMLLGSISLAEDGLPIGGASGLTSDDWAALVDAAEEKLFFTDEGDTGKEIIPEAPEQPEMPASYPYTDVDEVTLVQSETPADAYITASGAAILTHEAAGQWQIQVDGVWAMLPGETGATLTVTGAMLHGQKTGLVRKGLGEKNAETGEYAAYTQTAAVHIIESVPAMYSIARDAENTGAVSGADDGIMTLELANQENMVIIEVAYRISGTDQPVADSYVGQIAKKSALNTTLALPRVTGYQATGITVVPAELAENIAVFNAPSGENPGSVDLHVTAAHSVQDIIIYVEYAPAEVNFTVRHMWQNAENDEYEQHEVETLTGLTGAAVGADRQKPYPGFSYIWYDPTTAIAADGSTVVEIRYNREYYLMTFDLGGGYGVEPIYARFGATVNVDEPQRAGYRFAGWSLDGINNVELPSVIPAKDNEYKAMWTPADTTYTVVYWRADVDDGSGVTTYSYWGQKTVDAISGEVLIPSEVGKEHLATSVGEKGLDETGYFTYAEKITKAFNLQDAPITVDGDGTTVVNVYYSRNEYTIWFVYTRKLGNNYYFASTTGCGTYNNKNHSDSYHESTINGNKPAKKEINWSYSSKEKPVVAEGLTTGTFTETDGTAKYEYYYISLTAEYGANLEDVWPAAPLAKVGNKYDFGSWAVQCGSNYRIKYGNEHSNIVGAYPVMSSDLIMDPANKHAQTMVAWWGDTGAKVSAHTYHIYFEALPGETVDKEFKSRDNVTRSYVHMHDSVFTCAHNTNTRVDPFVYEGYTCVNDTRGTGNDLQANSSNYAQNNKNNVCPYKGTEKACAYCQTFYYKRNTYTLSFYNYNDDSVKPDARTLMFGESFTDYNPGAPKEPANVEPGSLCFVGWYTTPEAFDGTAVDWEGDTMPASDLTFYAQWELVKHDVRFWLDVSKTTSVVEYSDVTHGMTIPERYQRPEDYVDPTEWLETNTEHAYSQYDFAGWYYMDGEVEKRFDIKTIPIKSDMDIYAKWTSDKPVAFVFRYVYIDADGTEIELAPPTEGLALPFTPVTMSAKIGAELTNVPEGEDPLRYIPEVSSHTLNIQVDETKNEFVFEYSMPESVTYTVQYLEAVSVKDANGREVLVPMRDGNGNLIHMADEKTVQTTKAVVTENYVPVSGYMPQATQLRLIVSTNEDANVIQFLYLPNPDEEYINATHILIDHENQKIIAGTDQNILGKIGQMEGVQKREYTGYAFSYAEVEVTVLNGTQVTTSTVDAADISGNMVKHPLPNGGMHLYLYYTPVTYPYIVYHLDDQDRSKQLKDPTEGAALYGSTLTTSNFVQNIADYRVVSMTPAEIKVNVDDAENPTKNVMYIYYELDVADITITKNIAVSTEKDAPQPTQEELATAFTFQVSLKHTTKQQTEVYVTLPEQDKQSMSLQDGVLTFTLQSGQSATIHDLWGGTEYEVREIENAKFKTSYDAYSKGVLSSLDVHTVVTNTFPKYVGELTVKKTGMKDDKESAIVKAVVGNDVYYLVLNKSNGYTATISGIKPNTAYTVSEVTDWTWQYNATVGQATGTITETQATATVTINNTRETDKWLHDESHVENNFGTGKSIGVNE